MQIIYEKDLIKGKYTNLSIALGNFDGVHLGHQKIIRKALEEAKTRRAKSLIFTFHPHPMKVLKGEEAPKLLSTLKDRIEILREFNPHYLFIKKFDLAFAKIPYDSFVKEYLFQTFEAKDLIVGRDFSFGFKGLGSVKYLKEMEEECGFRVWDLDTVKIQGIKVKSTFIRKLVLEGLVHKIENFLGRPFSIGGKVVYGYGQGRMLGFPTANLRPSPHIITPPEGVYVVEVFLGEKVFPGIANLGFCPTFKGKPFTIEIHLLDFTGDLYKQKMKVAFLKRLRGEIAFSTTEDLKKRIKRDMELAREFLSNRFPYLTSV